MNNEIIQKIEQTIFKEKILNKLNTNKNKLSDDKNQDYKDKINESYQFDHTEKIYTLNEDLDDPTINEIKYILKVIGFIPYESIEELASFIRDLNKKYVLLFAYNSTGKTRLSMAFKDIGANGNNRDTLYFNAFTEDLFSWDNDLENNSERILKLNTESQFFTGLKELAMEHKIRPLLNNYVTFDFKIDYDEGFVKFERDESPDDYIKISKGEENIFIWCFFLAIAELAIDEDEAYSWVKYLYIDDPISSLDDNNTIAVASRLAQMLKKEGNEIKTVISSHHALFFNVLCNELKKAPKYFLSKTEGNEYTLKNTSDTPFFHHVSLIKDLQHAIETGNLYTYHFNILRSILEKTATFHGFKNFSACIKQDTDDEDSMIYKRIIDIMCHGNYSLYDPIEMIPENKAHFKKIFQGFMDNYHFNPEIFPE